jgi:hypothetical protein
MFLANVVDRSSAARASDVRRDADALSEARTT